MRVESTSVVEVAPGQRDLVGIARGSWCCGYDDGCTCCCPCAPCHHVSEAVALIGGGFVRTYVVDSENIFQGGTFSSVFQSFTPKRRFLKYKQTWINF